MTPQPVVVGTGPRHVEPYPNASLEVLSDTGHDAIFEAPVSLLTCAERFLDAL